ncbi:MULTISPECIES: restriction endonuclease subunit S [unclassified Roseovarius]|uniref:restriction endonuclease subunit S n=1 Tax=unclassified Roseovarius TaxID=2614913 RepID=UPI0018FE8AE4|nr:MULTISPECIES: restriction endonuclease subunit S [unclassified Roseovarius]
MGWVKGPFSEFIQPRGEKAAPSDHSDLKFIGMDHVEPHTMRIIGSVPASEMKSSAARFYKHDVLYGRLRPYLNKVAQPKFDGLASAEFIVFGGNELVDASFLRYRLNSRDFVNFANHLNEGDRPRVSFDQFGNYELLIPPLNEQRRIVEKIEAMFERIDKGGESLRAAKATLALYRQSLLKSAFEGRLTADWRAQNADSLDDPKTLLARIQHERDTRYKAAFEDWQTALTEWRDGGEKGKKPTKPKRAPEIRFENGEVDARNWGKFPLDVLISEMNQGWSPKCNGNDSIGPEDWTIVKTTAVQHRKYSDTALKRLPKNLKPRPEIEIQAGDFLMTRKGPRVRTGVVCLVRKTRARIMLCDTVYRFRCDDHLIYPPLLEYALNSPDTLREIDALKAGISESGISLNHGKVRSVRVSFPFDRAEQAEITRILDARLDAADKMEAEIDATLTRADALRQSILKQAFAGKLVPQDPTDEPAATHLARIRAERAQAPRARKQNVAHE